MEEPPAKKAKKDGNLALVDNSILLAAKDPEKWIEERRKNWPSKARIAQKMAENPPASQPPTDHTAPPTDRSGSETQSGDQKPGDTRNPPMCRYFLRGKCNSGDKCRFSHARSERPKPPPHERIYKRFEAPPASSLFVKLVQTDQSLEDERFLQFLEYITKKNKLRTEDK